MLASHLRPQILRSGKEATAMLMETQFDGAQPMRRSGCSGVWSFIKNLFSSNGKDVGRQVREIGHPGVQRDYEVARDGRM